MHPLMPTRPPRAYPNGQAPRPREPRPRKRQPNPYQHLYDSPEWRQGSKAFRKLHPRCQCEYHQGKPGAPKSECVDHIVPHRGDRAKFLDRSNWRALSWSCHTKKTNARDGGFGNPVRSGPDRPAGATVAQASSAGDSGRDREIFQAPPSDRRRSPFPCISAGFENPAPQPKPAEPETTVWLV